MGLLISSIVGWLLGSSSSHPRGATWKELVWEPSSLRRGDLKFPLGLMQTLTPFCLAAQGCKEVAAKEVFLLDFKSTSFWVRISQHFCLSWMIRPSTAYLLWNSMVWWVCPTVHTVCSTRVSAESTSKLSGSTLAVARLPHNKAVPRWIYVYVKWAGNLSQCASLVSVFFLVTMPKHPDLLSSFWEK